MYIALQSENMACFSDKIASETDFEETAVYRKKKKHPSSSEETANVVRCVSQKGWSDFEKSGPDSPAPRVKHASEGSEPSIFGFQNRFIVRDGLMNKEFFGMTGLF